MRLLFLCGKYKGKGRGPRIAWIYAEGQAKKSLTPRHKDQRRNVGDNLHNGTKVRRRRGRRSTDYTDLRGGKSKRAHEGTKNKKEEEGTQRHEGTKT